MRRTHEIKLNREFQDAVLSGEKSFEVRYNDRGYQKGDYIKFWVTDRKNVVEPLDEKLFEITYVLSGWHIEPNYVVFGILPVKHGGEMHGDTGDQRGDPEQRERD